jgi:hypothetical protein
MPLIFAENEETESGIEYADQTGVQYQYPKRLYKNVIRAGERFIYYRGRKTKGKARAQQVYFGCGIVGKIKDDSADSGRLSCEILDYQPFAKPVPFKQGKSDYLENGGKRKGYFQRGVRKISDEEFQRILEQAHHISASQISANAHKVANAGDGYASPDVAHVVDSYAMQAAENYLCEKYQDAVVKVMAKNNPGFDILITKGNWKLYVEVKGTQRVVPSFFMSSGELQFSHQMASQYLLLILYQINLAQKSHKLLSYNGAISGNTFELIPVQWRITTKET